MRKKLIFLILLLNTVCLSAQQTDYNSIVQPVEAKSRDFAEYLVQLAWINSPDGAAAMAEIRNARDQSKITGKEWSRDIQATFNLNEANLRPTDSSGSIFFPRYNFGINLNLYNVMTQGAKNRVSKRDIQIAEHQMHKNMLEIRAETLTRYEDYRLAREIQKTRGLVEQETYNNYILIQQLYRTDEKTFDEYATASTSYFQAQEGRIRADASVRIALIRLEEMIGIKWDQIQHPAKE